MSNVHFILDEAAMLGPMDSINDAVGIGRGYAIRLQFYYQSMGQLKRCFPDGQEHTLFSNTSQIFFGVNDNATADYVSARLGEHTIVVDSGGTGTGRSSQFTHGAHPSNSTGTSSNESRNWQQQPRKLLKPEEVIALSPGMAITFVPGVPPVCTRLLRYYEEKSLGKKRGGIRGRVTAWMQLMRTVIWCALLVGVDAFLTWALCRFPLGGLLRH